MQHFAIRVVCEGYELLDGTAAAPAAPLLLDMDDLRLPRWGNDAALGWKLGVGVRVFVGPRLREGGLAAPAPPHKRSAVRAASFSILLVVGALRGWLLGFGEPVTRVRGRRRSCRHV